VLGNAIEFFDFTTYAAFATMIGHAYFPMKTEMESLLLSVATFGAGFLTRPLGGIVIGAYADRHGRRPAMTLTIVLMALGTGLIAVIPPYSVIGVTAPVLVVMARLVQGFAVGGEVGPSTAYLLEAAPATQRARYGSWQSASQGIASLTAGLLGFALAQILTPGQLHDWGWRIPFALGVLGLPVGLYIRRRLEETLDHGRRHATAMHVVREAATGHLHGMVTGILAIMGGTVATYTNLYMTTYAQTTLGIEAGRSMLATLTVGIIGIAAAAWGGVVADRYGRRWVMVAPRIVLALVAWPSFLYLSQAKSVSALLAITALFTFLNSFSIGTVLVQVSDAFPQWVRSTAMAATYAISVSIFGGSTQYLITQVIDWTGDPVSPAYFLLVATLPSVVGAWLIRTAVEPA
jgi:MFS family permease